MIYSAHPSSPPLTQSDTHLHDTLMLGLGKHGSNINGVIHLGLSVRVKTCENTHTEAQSRFVCSEGKTGPFVKTPALSKQGV